jgi:hypothetical protein
MAILKDMLPLITKNGFNLSSAKALEIFGGDGTMHTKDYADSVKSLDIWECVPKLESSLRVNLPMANIIMCDPYRQIKKNTVHYDMIVVDNSIQTEFGHCEHFELFPDIFKIMNDDCLVILNLIPNVVRVNQYPELVSEYHLNKRKEFYNALDPMHITDDELTLTYNTLAKNNGFIIEWALTFRRSFVYYLFMKLKRWNNGSTG